MLNILFRKNLRDKTGQAALMILFVVALGLILYAVVTNLGRMSQTKTLVTSASNVAATIVASEAASYSQQIFKTYLGKNFKKCGVTGAVATIVGAILTVIGVILSPFTVGTSVALCVVGIALAGASYAIEVAVIAPAITNAWTKQMANLKTDQDRYAEEGLQTALQHAATDPELIDDATDMNGNGRFTGSSKGDDQIPRFAYLYQKRIHDMGAGGFVDALNYIDAVSELIFDGSDGWGLTDKAGIHCDPTVGDSFVLGTDFGLGVVSPVPSQCNPCCMPKDATYVDPSLPDNDPNKSVTYDLLPPSCDPSYVPAANDPTGLPPVHVTSGTCEAATPYPGYPYVFDKNYMDPWNNLLNTTTGTPVKGYVSFLEEIGRDDESIVYNRRFHEAVLDEDKVKNNSADVDGDGQVDESVQNYADRFGHPDDIPQKPMALRTAPTEYYFGDVDGYYPDDIRPGVFPFFWQAGYFGVDLNSLTKTDRKHPECVWCDPNDPENVFSDADPNVDSNGDGNYTNDPDEGSKCSPCYPDMVVLNTDGRVDQLSLGQMTGIEYPFGAGYIMDVLYEKNYFVDGTGSNVSGHPLLALDMISESIPTFKAIINNDQSLPIQEKIWVPGSPFYSSATWPYEYPNYYRVDQMDRMDWIIYGLKEYLEWALLLVHNDIFAANQLSSWADQVTHWKTRLQNIDDNIVIILGALRDWQKQTYKTIGCGGAWCIPGDPSQCTVPVPSGELATFGEGRMEDVAECLEWNSDPGTDPDPAFAGNAGRFKACLESCTVDACTDLPRTLVPGFNPNVNNISPANFDDWCHNPTTNDWGKNMLQSILEAQKQTIKMKMRAKFLRSLIDRRDKFIDILDKAHNQISDFLKIPNPIIEVPQSRSVIYGWKDKPNETLGIAEGLWHFVKAEVSLPNKLPWIKTYTKNWGTTRCYELTNTTGRVQVTVTRFDQPYKEQDGEKLKVRFGSGQTLWKFWTYNPINAAAIADLDLTGISQICKDDNAYAKTYDGKTFIEDAFITSEKTGPTCAEVVEKALKLGVSSTTCAQYGEQTGSGANKAFSFKFIGCN